jgi:hypothetical protein
MTDQDRPAPSGVNADIPNGARIYDYILGGKDNYAVDREVARKMIATNPLAQATARANRDFLGRAVRYLAAECGIRQFLDIGTGLPTQQNVHEVAQTGFSSRVVYVDYDPVVVVHADALLAGTEEVGVVQADLRDPDVILAHPDVRRLIDFSEPVAVLLVAILHFVSDEEDPKAILARFREQMAPGSHIVISHTVDESPRDVMDSARQGFKMAGAPLSPRTRAEVTDLFDGFDLLDPGVVDVHLWRPADPETAAKTPKAWWTIVGGVGRLP